MGGDFGGLAVGFVVAVELAGLFESTLVVLKRLISLLRRFC